MISKNKRAIFINVLRHLFLAAYLAGLCWLVDWGRPRVQIRENDQKEEWIRDFFQTILPAFDNKPWQEKIKNGEQIFYIARNRNASPQAYRLTSSALNTGKGPEVLEIRTHVSGFAFVMSSPNTPTPVQLLIGTDLNGEVTGYQKISGPAARTAELQEIILHGKSLIIAHRDLLMMQLEPREEPTDYA